MKKFHDMIQKRWFANAIAGCITVTVFLLLSNLDTVWESISHVTSYFFPVIGGAVIAYMMNPLAKFYERRIFRFVKKDSARWSLSVALAVISVLLFVALMLVILIPQLLDSITTFVANLGPYASSLMKKLNEFSLSYSKADTNKAKLIQKLLSSSQELINKLVDYFSGNFSKIITASTSAGKGLINWGIAFIISIYILVEKASIKKAAKKLLYVSVKKEFYKSTISFLSRCNDILNRFIIFDLIDGLIVGVTNAILMLVFGMQYIGLVSVIVGVTNLIPTVGPIIGGIIGAFILLMVNPIDALIFLIFTVILQIIDGYVIKPKLFGNTFGVSGLLILVAMVIGGKIFGIVGILLAIPFVAICDYSFKEIVMPLLERKRKENGKPDLAEIEASETEADPEPAPETVKKSESKPSGKKKHRK